MEYVDKEILKLLLLLLRTLTLTLKLQKAPFNRYEVIYIFSF